MNVKTQPQEIENIDQPFLSQLRQATSAEHKKLEEQTISKSIQGNNVTLKDYAFYLNCMREVISAYDFKILPYIKRVMPDVSARNKMALIKNDIDFLITKNAIAKAVKPFDVPPLTNLAFVMGMAYVIEGSTLGGQTMFGHLAKTLKITSTEGGQYFSGYGLQTGKRWKDFVEALASFSTQNKCESQVIAGAKACFNAINYHFGNNMNT